MSIFDKLLGRKTVAKPMAVGAFAEHYKKALSRAFPGAVITLRHGADAAGTSLGIEGADGFKGSQYLGNAYDRYRSDPDSLEQVIADHIGSAKDAQRGFASAGQEDWIILPVVKTRGWLEVSLQQLQHLQKPGDAQPFVIEPLAGDLLLTYVKDMPSSMSYLTPRELADMGLDRSALRAHALDNLARFLPQQQFQGGHGRYAVRLDRNYDASMVLLFERWRERLQLDGEPVLAIAARDELLICGSRDAESIGSLRAMAQKISRESAYGLSAELFTWRGGALQPLPVDTTE